MQRREFLDWLAIGTTAATIGCTTSDPPSANDLPDTDLAAAGRPLQIAMLLYPRFTALDLIGPHTILSQLSNSQVHLVAATLAPVTSDAGITITPTRTFASCPTALDVLFVPGGTAGTVDAMSNPDLLAFLRSRTAVWLTSVCTGSLVLGAAGLLRGYRATTHWVARDVLSVLEAQPVVARYVEDRDRITGAGVSAGIDFGLYLAAKLRSTSEAQTIQLNIEYDPAPLIPGGGNPETAAPPIVSGLEARYVPFVDAATAAAAAAAALFP